MWNVSQVWYAAYKDTEIQFDWIHLTNVVAQADQRLTDSTIGFSQANCQMVSRDGHTILTLGVDVEHNATIMCPWCEPAFLCYRFVFKFKN